MSYVLVFMLGTGGLLELNTYDDLKSCEAARAAGMQILAGNTYVDYFCVPKPD